MVAPLNEENPALMTKSVLPAAYKLMDETKSELRTSTDKLLRSLYEVVGSSLIEFAPSKHLQKIFDLQRTR